MRHCHPEQQYMGIHCEGMAQKRRAFRQATHEQRLVQKDVVTDQLRIVLPTSPRLYPVRRELPRHRVAEMVQVGLDLVLLGHWDRVLGALRVLVLSLDSTHWDPCPPSMPSQFGEHSTLRT